MKSTMLFFALCLAAAAIPFCSTGSREPAALTSASFPGWSAAPELHDVSPIDLGAREARFAADFPGQVGAFTNGQQTFVVRWIQQPTRKLHPAADCMRAMGYAIKPAPIFSAANGTAWGAHHAERGAEHVRIRERIVDTHGKSWTDLSRWYWSAVFGRTQGPWWSVTVLEAD